MNKKLLALAVGAAVVPGVALADGPKVYGKVNVSLEQYEPELDTYLGELEDIVDGTTDLSDAATKRGIDNDAQDRWQLDSNASRLGVKGDFDLDVADLKAIYKLEYEVAVDDGKDVFKQRNIYGGLKGGFGTLKAGKFDTPLKTAQGKIDQFNDLDADIKTILRGETRASNIIQYSTPKFADAVTLNIAVMPAENVDLNEDQVVVAKGDNGIADKTSISLVFEQSGVYGAIAMDKNNDDKTLLTDEVTGSPLDIMRVVGGFKADNFEFGALFQVAEEADKLETNEAAGTGEETSLVLSGAVKVDRWKFKAQYGMTEGSQLKKVAVDPLNTNVALLKDDPTLTLVALGADYKLAKASKVYVYYAAVEGELGLTGDIKSRTLLKSSYEDTTLGFGLEHKF